MSLSYLLKRIKSNDPTLKKLDLDNRPDTDSRKLEAIVGALAENSFIRSISMCNSSVDDSLLSALSLVLVENTSIEKIRISNNKITDVGVEYVSVVGTMYFC